MPDMMQPTWRSKPTMEAVKRSFMQFWLLTTTPVGDRNLLMKWLAHFIKRFP